MDRGKTRLRGEKGVKVHSMGKTSRLHISPQSFTLRAGFQPFTQPTGWMWDPPAMESVENLGCRCRRASQFPAALSYLLIAIEALLDIR